MGINIQTVTITGADDKVNPEDLVVLSKLYPFVEWGFLRSYTRTGSPRYPTFDWMERFEKVQDDSTCTSLHLCGSFAKSFIRGECIDVWKESRFANWSRNSVFNFQRVQLNGFSDEWWPMPRIIPAHRGIEFILQVQNWEALDRAKELYKNHPNTSILWDLSGGNGEPIDLVKSPLASCPLISSKQRIGYAGGINPDNVFKIVEYMHYITKGLSFDVDTWIDMESGVRTDDVFDLKKVEQVLKIVSSFRG